MLAPAAELRTGASLPSAHPSAHPAAYAPRPFAPTLSLRGTAPSSSRTVGACTLKADAEAQARRSSWGGTVYGSAAADELPQRWHTHRLAAHRLRTKCSTPGR